MPQPYHRASTAKRTAPALFLPTCGTCVSAHSVVSPSKNLLVGPKATIDEFEAVGKDQTATIKVEVKNNSNNLVITLNLLPNSGTGTANFTNTNSTTRTITQTENVEIKGITESSTNNNMKFKASFNVNGNDKQLDDENFTVISLVLSVRHGNSDDISADNQKKQNHVTSTGRSKLGGPFFVTGTGEKIWGHAIEIVGTVLPINYSGDIVLQREVVESKTYQGSTLLSNQGCNPQVPTPCGDTSFNNFLDKSVSSQGHVYDLDNPGFNLIGATTVGTIRRKRTNFRQWATVSQKDAGTIMPVRISSDVTWFHRLSVKFVGDPQTQLSNDVTGDNEIGAGTTLLTWNLMQ